MLTPLAKSVLISLVLVGVMSAADVAIKNNIFESQMTTLMISSLEIDDNMKIVKSLEELVLLIKGVSETIENEAKDQKCRFFSMSFHTLCANWLGNIMEVRGVTWAVEWTIREPHPLPNVKIPKY